jgi:hypothetical protein
MILPSPGSVVSEDIDVIQAGPEVFFPVRHEENVTGMRNNIKSLVIFFIYCN